MTNVGSLHTVRDKFLFLDFETTTRSKTSNSASPFDPDNKAVMVCFQKTHGQKFIEMDAENSHEKEVTLIFSGGKAYEYRNLEIGYKDQYLLEKGDYVFDTAQNYGVVPVRWSQIEEYLEDVHTIVAHSATFDILWLLRAFGLKPEVLKNIRIWCTQLAAYLLSAQTKIQPSLDELTNADVRYTKVEGPGYMWEVGYDTYEIPFYVLHHYLVRDVKALRSLYKMQLSSAILTDRVQFFKDQMEALLTHTLVTNNGMLVNTEVLHRWNTSTKLEEADTELCWSRDYERLLSLFSPGDVLIKPVKVGPGSRSVLSKLLFDFYITGSKTVTKQLKNNTTKQVVEEVTVYIQQPLLKQIAAYVSKGMVRDGNGIYPVSDDVLREYEWEIRKRGLLTNVHAPTLAPQVAQTFLSIISSTRTHRSATKLRSTYLEPMLNNTIMVDTQRGYLHPNFNFCTTNTGRLSSSKPNLQNQIDHPFKSAVEAPEGYRLVQMDYKQLEVIVLALLSADAGLIDLLTKGIDIHTALFEQVYGRSPNKDERKAFKACSFGLIYGSSAAGLVKTTGLDSKAVAGFMQAWKTKFPDSEGYALKIKENAQSDYVSVPQPGRVPQRVHHYRSPVGRMLAFKQYTHPDRPMQPNYSWPQMKNYPIQSLASDIVKGMITKLVRRILVEESLKDVRIINTVHDNVIMYVPEQNLDSAIEQIKDILESVHSWLSQRGIRHYNLPFKVDVEIGKNWYDLQPYQP